VEKLGKSIREKKAKKGKKENADQNTKRRTMLTRYTRYDVRGWRDREGEGIRKVHTPTHTIGVVKGGRREQSNVGDRGIKV
jgi:hypothetical protein